MTRAISIGWPSLIGKCRSISLRYSHWYLTGQFGTGKHPWCHCDFRKMEALKVNKFGRNCRTGTQAAQVIVVMSYYFLNLYKNVQLAKRDIVTAVIYYCITTEFHYAKDDSRLLAYRGVGTEVSYFCYICYKISKFRLKCLLTFFPLHNTSIRWATFRVMKIGRYVIADDGGNCTTFSQAVARIKIFKKIITPHNEFEPPVFQCDTFVQICLLLAPPSFWNRNDTKPPKPWKMSLILSNLHYTRTKRATFLWQTFIVSCSKRNIFIGPVDTVVWETVSFEK